MRKSTRNFILQAYLPEIQNLMLPKPRNTYLYSRYGPQPYHFKRTQLESKMLEQ